MLVVSDHDFHDYKATGYKEARTLDSTVPC